MGKIRMVLPKGRLIKKVVALLNDAGLALEVNDRHYLPDVSDPHLSIKIMKPQNIAQLVEVGSHDVGFTGYDWIMETGADVVTLLDLQFDPVSIVAAVSESSGEASLRRRRIVVASEYQNLTLTFLNQAGYDNHYFIRTFGATEVFPPDDADMIVDNVSSGRTLRAHHLKILKRILSSSTRFIANRGAMADPSRRKKIEDWVTVFRGILDARERVMLEMNVSRERLDELVRACPCMRAPTVAPLSGRAGYAVKIAVRREETKELIPRLKEMGASDILEYELRKVVL